MNVNLLKQVLAVSALGLVFLLGMSSPANAQNNRQPQRSNERNDERRKEFERAERERERYESLERLRLQSEYYRQDILEQQRIDVERIEQFREEQRLKNQGNRYRVYLDGKEYRMDYDGAELLRQGINFGYQQGFQTGKDDHKAKRAVNFNESLIYQNGTYEYQSSVIEVNLYQFYFRQGFERGYQDGFNNQKQFGKSTNGIRFISDTVSQKILNLQQF